MKRFMAVWGSGYTPREQIVGLAFFSEDNGYEDEDRAAIHDLEVAQVYEDGYPETHTIIRITDGDIPE